MSQIVQILIDEVIVVVVSLGRRMLLEMLALTTGSSATVNHILCQLCLLGPLLEEVWVADQVNVFGMRVLQHCPLLHHRMIHCQCSWHLRLLVLHQVYADSSRGSGCSLELDDLWASITGSGYHEQLLLLF